MRRYRRKHRESDFIETAVADWGDTVYRVALNQTGSPTDAEDVRQDVFERLLTSAPSFADSEHLKAWLLRATILYVTHDPIEALSLATIVAVMEEGRIVQFGAPEDILASPAGSFLRESIDDLEKFFSKSL